MDDARTAIEILRMFSRIAENFIKGTLQLAAESVKQVGEGTRELVAQNKETKLQKEANKGGEIAINKLQKNHKEVVSEVIQPENLNSFKKFAKEFNLQYATSKEDDGKVKIHFGTDHQDRFNTTVDSLARSINFKQQNAVNEVKAELNTVKAEMTISKDDNVKEINPKELSNKELISAIKDLNEQIKGLNNKIEKLEEKIADLEGKNKSLERENVALKRENKDLSNKDLSKENIRFIDRPDTKTVSNLDDLVKSATNKASKHNEALKENKLELGMHGKKLSMER